MKRGSVWIVLVAALLLAGTARAEDAQRTLVKGRWSLAFALPDGGGGAMGVWKMVSAKSNLGINLAIDHEMSKTTVGPDTMRTESGGFFWLMTVGPSLKRYLVVRERVSPFLFASAKGSYGWGNASNRRMSTLEWGLGADWTPLESISIGASTGIRWVESKTSYSETGAPKISDSLFDTMTTELTMHLYF
jgi:hypothetical protein